MARRSEASEVADERAGSPDGEGAEVTPLPLPRERGSTKMRVVETAPEAEKAPEKPGEKAREPAPPWRSYKERVASLASRIVEGQRPIRVLQALSWDASVEEQFRKSRYRELPRVDEATYQQVDLGFDPAKKAEEFEEIARDVHRELGENDAIAHILHATAIEYREVVRMLGVRGTKAFHDYSRTLYGSPKDLFPDGRLTVRESGRLLYDTLTKLGGQELGPEQPRDVTAQQAADILNQRFSSYFDDTPIHVQVDDAIAADAAAGSDYVKIRSGARFSQRDIDILEVHEGWVHIATSLNGQAQPVAKWLGKGPPRTTAVQEGLAALVEILTLRIYPRRARRLNDRVIAVDKAEDGASFLDVFEWFRTEGYDEEECFHNARRIFRGGTLEGGAPFTKDACYAKGIVLNYAFMRAAIQHRRAHLIPYLFVGKVAHEDVPVLYARVQEGVVRPPLFIPPFLRDLSGLAIWVAYSDFLTRLGSDAVTEYYASMFRRGA